MNLESNNQDFRLPEELLYCSVDVVLATLSPRRIELFGKYGLPYISHGAQVDEEHREGESPEDFTLRLAYEKADALVDRYPGALVIGSDTVVVNGESILGKPSDEAEAAQMLQSLSGCTHRVLTGVALVCKDILYEENCIRTGFVECTNVRFRLIRNSEIEAYIRTGEPLDKAGAYGIQGGAGAFVETIEGSFTNVIGLPMEHLREVFIEYIGRHRG